MKISAWVMELTMSDLETLAFFRLALVKRHHSQRPVTPLWKPDATSLR